MSEGAGVPCAEPIIIIVIIIIIIIITIISSSINISIISSSINVMSVIIISIIIISSSSKCIINIINNDNNNKHVIIIIVTVDFRHFIVFFLGRDPGTLKSDIESKKHPKLISSDLRLLNWKFEDWNYGNRPYVFASIRFCPAGG